MKTYRFSQNKKTNGVLNEIYADLLTMCDTEEESRNEVKRYRKEFPRFSDCNLVDYGNMLIYYDDIREMYRRHGYKSLDRLSDNKVWDIYKHQVGYVARMIAREAI